MLVDTTGPRSDIVQLTQQGRYRFAENDPELIPTKRWQSPAPNTAPAFVGSRPTHGQCERQRRRPSDILFSLISIDHVVVTLCPFLAAVNSSMLPAKPACLVAMASGGGDTPGAVDHSFALTRVLLVWLAFLFAALEGTAGTRADIANRTWHSLTR
jgi:hypothetical protein